VGGVGGNLNKYGKIVRFGKGTKKKQNNERNRRKQEKNSLFLFWRFFLFKSTYVCDSQIMAHLCFIYQCIHGEKGVVV
jgi:hypothetical protein